MKRKSIAASALVVAVAIPSLAAAQPQLTLDWPAMADRLVTQLALEPASGCCWSRPPGCSTTSFPTCGMP